MQAKGKSEPIPVWEALQARSRFGVDLAAPSGSPSSAVSRRSSCSSRRSPALATSARLSS
ncbi:MAG: hypothetical protein H0V68_02885 [Actinobacteria bacterium]|nr:hypothetical protein [Actinomycetota bacterium]